MTYRDRRHARADRLRGWAESNDRKGEAATAAGRQVADMIPLGQPILLGHHSQRADTNRRARMVANMEKGYELGQRADEQRRRADSIDAAADRAIYRDDPDELDRLRVKLEGLETERATIRAYNVAARKGTADPATLPAKLRADLESVTRHCPYQLSAGGGFPSYALSNLAGTIGRVRGRIADAERRAGGAS